MSQRVLSIDGSLWQAVCAEYGMRDGLLKLAIDHLIYHWHESVVGVVSCGVLDVPHEKIFLATSTQTGEKQWRHAEFNALALYHRQQRSPQGTYAAITLSPCIDSALPDDRVGVPCADRLIQAGIQECHYGVLDATQGGTPMRYRDLGLRATETDIPLFRRVCYRLTELFSYTQEQRKGINPQDFLQYSPPATE